MKKSIIVMTIVAAMLIGGAIYETNFVQRQFKELHAVFSELYVKVDGETAVYDDVIAVQNNWLEKKKYLHAFIPHNEIKEFDLWLSESAILVRDGKWSDALSKIEVLKELAEQIPKTFAVTWENIL